MKCTVETIHGCTIITGLIPIGEMVFMLESFADEGKIVSSSMNMHIGTTLVAGTQEDLDAFRASPEFLSRSSAKADIDCAGIVISPAARQWLVSGERGSSSQYIFHCLTGAPGLADSNKPYPRDPADFRRCRLLLEQVPEFRDQFSTMSEKSVKWSALIRHWEWMNRVMDEENPDWRSGGGSSPALYKLIKEILEPTTQPDTLEM